MPRVSAARRRRQKSAGGVDRRSNGGGTHGRPLKASSGSLPSPLREGLRLRLRPRWALYGFLPAYRRARAKFGADPDAIVEEILFRTAPNCCVGEPSTGAEEELKRRVALAVAALLNSEGVPVEYPPRPPYPRPQLAQQITQPWLRALLTGWV